MTISLRDGFLRKNSCLQGKKHSKIGHLASIFDAAGAGFDQKYRRKAECQQTLGLRGQNNHARHSPSPSLRPRGGGSGRGWRFAEPKTPPKPQPPHPSPPPQAGEGTLCAWRSPTFAVPPPSFPHRRESCWGVGGGRVWLLLLSFHPDSRLSGNDVRWVVWVFQAALGLPARVACASHPTAGFRLPIAVQPVFLRWLLRS